MQSKVQSKEHSVPKCLEFMFICQDPRVYIVILFILYLIDHPLMILLSSPLFLVGCSPVTCWFPLCFSVMGEIEDTLSTSMKITCKLFLSSVRSATSKPGKWCSLNFTLQPVSLPSFPFFLFRVTLLEPPRMAHKTNPSFLFDRQSSTSTLSRLLISPRTQPTTAQQT